MTLTTHRLPHDGDGYSQALSYDRLEEPWREWAKIARNFARQLDEPWDREDLIQHHREGSRDSRRVSPTGEVFVQMGGD